MSLSAPCRGHEPLILRTDRDRCFMCGRYLEGAIGTFDADAAESVAYGALALAVERAAEELRRDAAEAGYLDTPERYAAFIEQRMAADEERERRLAAHNGKRGRPRRSVGASVRSPYAPVVL